MKLLPLVVHPCFLWHLAVPQHLNLQPKYCAKCCFRTSKQINVIHIHSIYTIWNVDSTTSTHSFVCIQGSNIHPVEVASSTFIFGTIPMDKVSSLDWPSLGASHWPSLPRDCNKGHTMRCVSLRSTQKNDTWIGFQGEFAWRNPTTPALWLLSGGKININIYDSSEFLWCFVCAVCMLATCGVIFPQLGSLNWIESTISSAAHPHSTDSWQWMRHWFDASSTPRKVWELLL